jgi:fructan beta-fructosidase
MHHYRPIVPAIAILSLIAPLNAAEDIVIADFESSDFGDWKVEGEAFGGGPVEGTLPNQRRVYGFEGKRLVNSYHGGDNSIGILRSPEFRIERPGIRFLIGGGDLPNETGMHLLIDGKTVRSATGAAIDHTSTEQLLPGFWDVSEFKGKTTTIEIFDRRGGSWGHVTVDSIMQSDKPPIKATPTEGDYVASARYLHLPVKEGAQKANVVVSVDGKMVQRFEMELSPDPSKADWWAHLDLSPWEGKSFQVKAEGHPAGATTFSGLEISDQIKNSGNLYEEALRPQFHFSSRRGWLNDPNGLVYYDGVYHLFYQHNPYGTKWGNMHWGHAVSSDLVHWKELDIALYPDRQWMWSGSGVVDWKNVSGLGQDGKPPLLFFYTAQGGGANTQCLAWSLDNGKTLHKYEGNPIIGPMNLGERDPKVVWDPGSKKWIMVLYVGKQAPGLDSNGNPNRRNVIDFFSSSNLIEWKHLSEVEGYYECPDFFQIALDDDAQQAKWVLTGANGSHQVGTFDGTTFHPETPILHGPSGNTFYAVQSYSDIPPEDSRRIQIGWLKGSDAPGMPFSQCMAVPVSVKLVSTPNGPRMTWTPVKELKALRKSPAHKVDLSGLKPNDPNPFANVSPDATELFLEIAPGDAQTAELKMRGVPLTIDFKKNEFRSGRIRVSLNKSLDEPAKLRIFQDRTSIEVFYNDGKSYVPLPAVINPDDRTVSLSVAGGESGPVKAELFELKSAWTPEAKAQR